MKMSVDELRRRLQALSDEQLEQFLLRTSGQAPAPEKKPVPPPPAQDVLPKEILEEMAAMRKTMRLRPSSLDTEHMKWLRTCEGLQKLPMGGSAFCGAGDREVYSRLKQACQERLLPESLCRALVGDLLAYIETGRMRPVILSGEAGCGKTTAAKAMAELLCIPYYMISAPRAAASHGLSGETRAFRGADAGEPVKGMLAAGVRNPVYIIDEVDKAVRTTSTAPLEDELLSMCDGSREIYDNFVGCRFDLSHSPVFMTCNDLDAVAKPLRDRCTVIRFPEVDLPRLYQMMERYCAGRKERYHDRVTMETAVIRQLCEKLYQKGVRSIRQHQSLLDCVMEDAYIQALEGGEPIVTADSAAWAVDKVAGGNPHRVGF